MTRRSVSEVSELKQGQGFLFPLSQNKCLLLTKGQAQITGDKETGRLVNGYLLRQAYQYAFSPISAFQKLLPLGTTWVKGPPVNLPE